MTRAALLRSPLGLIFLFGLNVALGLALASAPAARVTILALLPALVVAAAALIASNRAVLIFGAFALDLSGILPLRKPVIGSSIFASDLILLLALGSWLAAWLIAPSGRRPSWLRTPLFGWPLLVFAIFIGNGVVRGHERWGLSYLSQPLRFVLYAGIAAAIAGLKPRQAWKGLVVVFYLGAISNAIAAVYYIATGTQQDVRLGGELATGGRHILTLTTALYLTGAFVLALLSLEQEQQARRRMLHLLVGALAGFGIFVSYGRGVFYSLAAVIFVLCLTRSRLRNAAFVVLPIVLSVVVLTNLLIGTTPSFARGLTKRVTTTNDPSIQWRQAANAAVWQQVRQDPLLGVGFGKHAQFVANFNRWDITQDPHDSYLFLWAGGGILTLGSFILLFLIFLGDSWRRYRSQVEQLPRALIAWCVSLWFCFALNTLVEPQLTQSNSMLVFWSLMLLPAIVPCVGKENRHPPSG
jgi:O-antigen ligase/polysaccharide polymerase Wzy-like membrane protein